MKSRTLFFLALIILLICIVKWGHSIHTIFGTDYLNPNKEPNYIVNKEDYHKYCRFGEKEMKNEKIVICGCVRDVAKNASIIKRNIEMLGSKFKDYRCLIVENDSTDDSRKELLKMSMKNPKIIILGCGINSNKCELKLPKTEGNSFTKDRIDKMAYIRNIYLDFIKDNYDHVFKEYKYGCVWDLDIIGTVYNYGVSNTLGYMSKHPDISAMCANGYYKIGPLSVYYDTYAHLEKNSKFDINYKLLHDIKTVVNNFHITGEYPREVESCFSGFTIYRLEDFVKANYESSEDGNIECEHTHLNRSLPNKCMVNPSLDFYLMKNEH